MKIKKLNQEKIEFVNHLIENINNASESESGSFYDFTQEDLDKLDAQVLSLLISEIQASYGGMKHHINFGVQINQNHKLAEIANRGDCLFFSHDAAITSWDRNWLMYAGWSHCDAMEYDLSENWVTYRNNHYLYGNSKMPTTLIDINLDAIKIDNVSISLNEDYAYTLIHSIYKLE